MSKPQSILILTLVLMIAAAPVLADDEKTDAKPADAYQFTVDVEVERTPVKNQYRTGTCWCFATISFLESELLRTGKGEHDLSEMFVVRNTYPRKADNFFRLHGNANFSQGGQAHDVLECVKRFGLVPEGEYSGMRIQEKRHNHSEMVTVLSAMMDGVIKNRGTRVTPRWSEALSAVLDVYLGPNPQSFVYQGSTYTPESFADDFLQIDPNDYVELTSYTHHPFYEKCRLELPDNWDFNSEYFNVPIDDLELIINNALKTGHSVVWDGDVSEKEFSSRELGFGVVPNVDWEDRLHDDQKLDKVFEQPVQEKEISQELRQRTFDSFATTDDHLMHLVGLAHDQNGTTFYLTKNSGGTDRRNEGYLYMSRAYVRLKTMAIMVHKDAIPAEISAKLGL